jgi:hypothetical protein
MTDAMTGTIVEIGDYSFGGDACGALMYRRLFLFFEWFLRWVLFVTGEGGGFLCPSRILGGAAVVC